MTTKPDQDAASGEGITERERQALHALWPPPHPCEGWGESEQEHREGVEAAYLEASSVVRSMLRMPLSIMAGHLEEKRIDPSRCTCYPQPCWYREWLLEHGPQLHRGRRDAMS
ncbi:hypothetical protein AB0H77_09565 [Streptomyces sp. NPDC050844]|uniref:hypothetical protein n=1 Tax=Streptomyces sp. NPDC050844 TaxID=3155790 RepID=UPI0033FBF290